MEHLPVELTLAEHDTLNSLCPKSEGSALIGRRAVEIVKVHFKKKDPQCRFMPPLSGADLRVILSDGSSIDIEVKGTDSVGLAWQQLKSL